jgi:hypothetical protein
MKTIIAQKTIAGLAASVLLSFAASAAVPTNPAIYYNADGNHYLGTVRALEDTPGATEIGDQVTFAGTLRDITDLQYNYFLSGNASGNETAQLFLRALDGPTFNGFASPGSTLYTGDIVNLVPSNQGSVTVNGITGFTMPDTVAWSVVFGGIEAGESVGLLYYDPPNTGTSDDDFWARIGGSWQLLDQPGIKDNFGFAAYAVPEPGTWALMLGGLGLLGFLRRRKA